VSTVPCSVSWACTDCLILLANGDDPAEKNEQELADWHAAIDRHIGDSEITIGMLASEHADDCPVKIQDTHDAVDECDCETDSFSWSACDVCGSNLGGERHAVTYWVAAP
jgi:hypothetical protein